MEAGPPRGKTILRGTEALKYAATHGGTVNKWPDLHVGACRDLPVEDAIDALETEPSLAVLFWVEAV